MNRFIARNKKHTYTSYHLFLKSFFTNKVISITRACLSIFICIESV